MERIEPEVKAYESLDIMYDGNIFNSNVDQTPQLLRFRYEKVGVNPETEATIWQRTWSKSSSQVFEESLNQQDGTLDELKPLWNSTQSLVRVPRSDHPGCDLLWEVVPQSTSTYEIKLLDPVSGEVVSESCIH